MPEWKAKRQNDYIFHTYERINLTVFKGRKAELKTYAESHG